jgi:ribosomal protein S18 acetylase RimI-like enzyme
MSHVLAPNVEVADLAPHELPAAIGVVKRGMRDNPMHVAAFGPDPERRERVVGRLLGAALTHLDGQEPLVLRRDGEVVAVCGGMRPGTCRPSARETLRMLPAVAVAGPRTVARVGRWMAAWQQQDLGERHAHLGPVAVDAHLQGQGLGSVLLAEWCRRADAAGHVAFLETDKPENVRFYARAGFEVVAQEHVLGVPNWFMRREPGGHRA